MSLRASLKQLQARAKENLPGLLGVEILDVADGHLEARLPVRDEVLAPNNRYLHAATVVALADTACGFGCFATLSEEAKGFTTIELKANFLSTARAGAIRCTATRIHAGRTTEVWDAAVQDEASGKTIAVFRCTELLLNR